MSESSSSDVDWEAVDDETLAQLEAEQAKYAAELEELRLAERHAVGVSSGTDGMHGISDSGQTAGLSAENARLRAELEARVSVSASATRRDADDVKVKLAKVSAEIAKLTAALATGVGLSGLTAVKSSASVLAASRKRMMVMDKGIAESTVKASDMHSVLQELETREKGVDLCILMDGTGSMGWCINTCKDKANEIMAAAKAIHADAILRVACVIYRDHYNGPSLLTAVNDFVGKEDLTSITDFLSSVKAICNNDSAESVASGLQEAIKLSWRSSTKLLIHFGDAPAHGRQYHTLFVDDNYLAGDPSGVVPEHVVKQLCNNRVNYYFAQINTSTVQMTNIFAEEYKHSQNAVFKILEYTASAATFIPMVVESIRDSMKRSSFFGSGRSGGSASHRSDKGDHRTVFHSVL